MRINKRYTDEELRQGKWNGKIYGKEEKDNLNIYLDDTKQEITKETAEYLKGKDLNLAVFWKYNYNKENTKEYQVYS